MGEKGVPLVSNMFSLDRYYAAADSVLLAFNQAYEAGRLDDAYVYGKRFAIFSLNALPTHNYYNSPKYNKARAKNQHEMVDVVSKLEQVAKMMDQEEVEKERERRRKAADRKRRDEERARQEAEEARVRLANFQKETNAANQQQQKRNLFNVEQSALDKLRVLQGGVQVQNDRRSTGVTETMSELNIGKEKRRDEKGPSQQQQSSRGRNRPLDRPSRNSSDDSLRSNGSDDPGRRPLQRRGSMESTTGRQGRRHSNEREREPAQRRSSIHGESIRRQGSNDSISDVGRSSRTEEPRRRTERRLSMHTDGSLPPPMVPPVGNENGGFPPPPSYNSVVVDKRRGESTKSSTSSNQQQQPFPPSVLEQAAAHATGQNALFPQSQIQGNMYANRELEKEYRSVRKEKVSFRSTKQRAAEKYQELRANNRIKVMSIPTHQGRLGHSTNGCAVISPLVVSRHLHGRSAVTDDEIVSIIDRECGPLLRDIRGKLGLGGDALIIPSDVHDYLVDEKLLSQEAFVGATGGNIMDPKHLAEFLQLLDVGEKNSHRDKRTGAALFFREHVVSIVKVPLSPGKWCFDLIDSLPGSTGQASRTRCRDLSAFEAYVRYYASKKFSESNCDHIDKNDWNDTMADFDPRVFQGFVWGDR